MRACEAENVQACYRAGLILERGRDGINAIRPDAERSEALMRRACAGGHADACR